VKRSGRHDQSTFCILHFALSPFKAQAGTEKA
jgi:hypothetical protein